MCRCGTEEETWGHILEKCRENRKWDMGWQDAVRGILAGNGRGIEWIRRLVRERREEEGGECGNECEKEMRVLERVRRKRRPGERDR